MSNYPVDQLRGLYEEYAQTIKKLTAQNFFRGQSVIEDLIFEMKEIAETLQSVEEFDKQLQLLQAQVDKNYEYFLSRAEDFS